MFQLNRTHIINLLIILIGGILYIPLTGRLHLFDWDEINFAESAREMIVSGDYLNVQIFYKPFWEKPPLFIWMQVLSMKVFGINEFAARFPNAICGIATLLILFNTGRKVRDERFGIIWTIAYLVSILPFIYFKSGIIDPWFNLFIFLCVIYWINGMNALQDRVKTKCLLLSGFFLGLAILTKGPAAGLIAGLTVGIVLLLNMFKFQLKFKHVLLFLVALILTGGFWFILMLFTGNKQLISDFITYQIRLFTQEDAGHGGFPMYHFVVLLIGVFPASVFAIIGHKKFSLESKEFTLFRWAMIVLFWIVLILFSIVKTKIVHYSSMCYMPMTFLAAYAVENLIDKKARFRWWWGSILLVLGIIIALVGILVPVFGTYRQWFIDQGYVTHSFTIGNLQADPGWSVVTSVIGLQLLIAIIASVILLKQEKIIKAFTTLAASCLLFISLTVVFVVPGAEKISQNVVIEFFKDKSREDAYFHTFYKSYAMLFYTKAPKPALNSKAFDERWLATGDIDKKVYFVIRVDKKDYVLGLYPKVEEMFEKNGYVFCVRYPESN